MAKVTTSPPETPKTTTAPQTNEPLKYKGETFDEYYKRVVSELKPGQPVPDQNHLFYDFERAALGVKELVEPKDYFTIGATQDEVRKAMGVPTSISNFGNNITWSFDSSNVIFTNGKVSSYHNNGNLNVY